MRRFSLDDILWATNNFDESLVIRTGGFGRVYKVPLHESVSVVIGRLANGKARHDFQMEIEVLSKARHRNILSLIGYCRERGEMILVYERVPFRTLGDHLYGGTAYSPLTWAQRLKACVGAARGLDYLHTVTSNEQEAIHRDLRSADILLDENWEAKVGGFGLSQVVVPRDESASVTGARGVMDQGYVKTGKQTGNLDVYSIGVVLLEVLSGRRALETVAVGREQQEEQNLVELAKQFLKDGMLNQIIDPRLRGQAESRLDDFVDLAEKCLHVDPRKRPRMSEVVSRLEGLLAWEEGETVDVGGPSSNQDVQDSIIGDVFSTNKNASYQEVQTNALTEVVDARTTQSDIKSAGKTTFRGKIRRYLLGLPDSVSGSYRWQRRPNFGIFSAIESTLHRFSFAEIQMATNHFDEELAIGEGGFGKVYKGTLSNGSNSRKVAIKRRSSRSHQGLNEFETEVEVHSKVWHKHFVSLIGYCHEGRELILVYEYMARGNLGNYLYGGDSPLSWTQRLDICIGIGRGIDYLHTCTRIQKGVIHRGIKSADILLGKRWEAKISDFGSCRIVHANESLSHVSTDIIGTFGYVDPEYIRTGILTTKSDVYSFGVVLCEVLCGKKAMDSSYGDGQQTLVGSFLNYLKYHTKSRILDQIIDPRLNGQVAPDCLDAFAQIVDCCLLASPEERPTMSEIVARLESLLSLQQSTCSSGVGETISFGSDEIQGPSVRKGVVLASNKEEIMVCSPDSEIVSVSDGSGQHHEEIDRSKRQAKSVSKAWSGPDMPPEKKTRRKKAKQLLSGLTDVLLGTKYSRKTEKLSSVRSHKHGVDQSLGSYSSSEKEDASESSESERSLKNNTQSFHEDADPAREPNREKEDTCESSESEKSLKHKTQPFHEDADRASEPNHEKEDTSESSESEKSLKHDTQSFEDADLAREPNREAKDGEFSLIIQKKSSADLMLLDYIRQADVLMRRKDFLHIILFYPMKIEEEVDFGSLVDKFSSLNKYIRKSVDPSMDADYLMKIQILLQDVEERLDDSAFDMGAYLPEDLVQNMCGSLEFLPFAYVIGGCNIIFFT